MVRRDSKNRILRTGETQGKDGRYRYKYRDGLGIERYVYSWRLVETDATPPGKRKDTPLREKIKKVERDMYDGINTYGGGVTVYEVCETYVRQKKNIRPGTVLVYERFLKKIEKDRIGHMKLNRVKGSHVREFVIRLHDQGISYKTIEMYYVALRWVFKVAIDDDLIRKNPANWRLSSVILPKRQERTALTDQQVEVLTQFAKNHRTYSFYYDHIIILLGTGMRIGELCGLTTNDIDMNRRVITVDHQMVEYGRALHITKPKTKAGRRQIYMNDEVHEAFKQLLERPRPDHVIDGYTGFLIYGKKGGVMSPTAFSTTFKNMVKKLRATCDIPMPELLTPHVLRHTFCTRLINSGMNPKAVQYIMGHSNVKVTLNYYTHMTGASAMSEMKKYMD